MMSLKRSDMRVLDDAFDIHGGMCWNFLTGQCRNLSRMTFPVTTIRTSGATMALQKRNIFEP